MKHFQSFQIIILNSILTLLFLSGDVLAYKESDFYKNIYSLLYQLLSEHGGLILIDQRNLVLWDSSIDITDEAIEMIDRINGDGK